MMKEKILITSALPYANGLIHFGHIAGAYLPADCYARFQRMQKKDVLYVCGSDEYGVAIALSAEMAKRDPKEHAEIFHKKNLEIFKKLKISFDHYSRTTWEGHEKTVKEFFLEICDNGYIEEKEEEHLYSEKEKKFLADRYVEGTCPKCGYEKARGDECTKCAASFEAIDLKNPRSKLTQSPLILKKSKHWYLRFDKFKDRLKDWIKEKKWKQNVKSFALNYLKDLKPRSITRDLGWGIKVPIESAKDKVLYVWFDAPIGYISATKEWAEKVVNDKDRWKDYWFDKNTKLIHFIGKDNIPFHTLFFPAMIMAQNQPYILPDQIPANEFLLLEKKQFSKSEGWYIDLDDFFINFTSDQIRYYLAANAPETSDSEFTWMGFLEKCNSELLGKLGNFVNRTFVFAKNHFDLKMPEMKDLDDKDRDFLFKIDEIVEKSKEAFENFHVKKAAHIIMELCDLGNIYFDHKEPWKEVKQDILKAKNTISLCLECIKSIALISFAIIPDTAQKIWNLLGYKTFLKNEYWLDVQEKSIEKGQKLNEPKLLFKKVEKTIIQDEIDKLYNPKKPFLKDDISFEYFSAIDLRVGKIISCEKIKKSKKLLKLNVDLGFEKRQIISGIAHLIDIKDLVGKKVLVLINLEPRKLMGEVSEGMILAAGEEDNFEIPLFSKADIGSIVS